MAQEIKNTFLKSKMNKDLDDRILPNGEYRDARNISVGRSEDDDVGALENVIGNALITATQLPESNLTVIGTFSSDLKNQIFLFLTNYNDPNPTSPTDAPIGSIHFIYAYNLNDNTYTKLIEGEFLNFSKSNRIIGINLIEDLLFWTDNRNQPRKINITLASSNTPNPSSRSSVPDNNSLYYQQEHQISVAKYSPYQAIKLYNTITVENISNSLNSFSVGGDQTAELLPYIGGTVLAAGLRGNEYVTLVSVTITGGGSTRCSISPAQLTPIAPGPVQIIKSTMTNESANDEWPGDPNYLEDRFVRFSYRFKYDDNEYSLMAPFTQIAYIPTQKGYFIQGDEDAAYQSTVVQFMKNNVQNIGLVVPLPTSGSQLSSFYKIQEIELLFREAGGVAVKVLESIPVNTVSTQANLNNSYTYEYQSRKPYRTLPEAQTVRVYDKVPIRAFSQESAGNRIIYGNYRDQHTPPTTLNYNCRISDKKSSVSFTNFIEYPNHSVKRNRNYQIGFVLADKFGRQSPVILSSVDIGITEGGDFFAGSTIYSPYDDTAAATSVQTWFGDAIQLTISSPVTSSKNSSTGTPGLYAIPTQRNSNGLGYAIANGGSIANNQYIFILDTTFPNNTNVPIAGDSLRGEYTDYVLITDVSIVHNTYTLTTVGRVSSTYLYKAPPIPGDPVFHFSYKINDLGWYSYKIVVKQTQQEYYNAYLPGFLNGYPDLNAPTVDLPSTPFPTGEDGDTAHVVLLNDNINKIPRDLKEVGPDQKQYRSSVKLYGRVNNVAGPSPTEKQDQYTAQYLPRKGISANAIANVASTISTAKDLQFSPLLMPTISIDNFYQLESNPYVARINTSANAADRPIGIVTTYMLPNLTIYETEAVESLLNIYWETTSEGLITDLNIDVNSTGSGPTSTTDVDWDFDEFYYGRVNDIPGSGQGITNYLSAFDSEGQDILSAEWEIISATDNQGNDASDLFDLKVEADGSPEEGQASITLHSPIAYVAGSFQRNPFTIILRVTANDSSLDVEASGNFDNVEPTIIIYDGTVVPVPDPGVYVRTIFDNQTIILPFDKIHSKNGSFNDAENQIGLVYSLIGAPPEGNWYIDEFTGEVTQERYALPQGDYAFQVRVRDTSGLANENSMNDIYDVIIKIRPTPTDINLFSNTCITNLSANTVVAQTGELPPSKGDVNNPYPGNPGPGMDFRNNGGIFSLGVCGYNDSVNFTENAVWYISQGQLPLDPDSPYEWNDIDGNPIVPFNSVCGPNNSVEVPTYYTKMNPGAVAHTQGTVDLSWNIQMQNNPEYIENFNPKMTGFSVNKITYYYRYSGTNAWVLLPRSADPYNNEPWADNCESPGGFSYGGSNPEIIQDGPAGLGSRGLEGVNPPQYDFYSTNTIGAAANDPQFNGFVTGGRVSDFATFEGVPQFGAIEYAVVFMGLRNSYTNFTFGSYVSAWPTFSDLNYPTCMPINGSNVVDGSGEQVFQYQRTVETGTWIFPNPNYPEEIGEITFPNTPLYLYSNIAKGEYVPRFYTDNTLSTIYKPTLAGEQFINYKNVTLANQPFNSPYTSYQSSPWYYVGPSGGVFAYPLPYAIPVELTWAAGFSAVTGEKIMSTSPERGVGSIQTTTLDYAAIGMQSATNPDTGETFAGNISGNKIAYRPNRGTLRCYLGLND